PLSWSPSLTSTRPAADPSPTASTTNSTQIPTAAQRCRALQPPARAARPRTRPSPLLISGSLLRVRCGSDPLPPPSLAKVWARSGRLVLLPGEAAAPRLLRSPVGFSPLGRTSAPYIY